MFKRIVASIMNDKAFFYKAVVFDMDGTLTVPRLDFAAMRRELGIPSGDLATCIAAWEPKRRAAAWACIERHEHAAREEMELQVGVPDLLHALRDGGVHLGVLTRNTAETVEHLCARFGVEFDIVIDRAFPTMKPDPEPLLYMLRTWALDPRDAVMVGDYADDVTCARRAGAVACYFHNARALFHGEGADCVVRSMAELETALHEGVPVRRENP